MRNNLPFLHLDHAYFKRGYEHGNVRVNFGHFHQTALLPVTDYGTPLASKRLQPWKKDGSQIIVISPSESITRVLYAVDPIKYPWRSSKEWVSWSTSELTRYTRRSVIVKKKGGSILDFLRNAHACVSLSSVAEVESTVFGVPVFTSDDSPAAQVSEKDLSRIETPIYPDREQWLKTLSYSQFHSSQLADGTAITKIKGLYGYQHLFNALHGGSELVVS